MSSPEKKAKDEVVAVLKKLECTEHFAPRGGPFGAIGVADRIACINGRYVAIECKAGVNKLSPMQAHRLKSTVLNGGVAVAYWAGNECALSEMLYDALGINEAVDFYVVHSTFVGEVNDANRNKFVNKTKEK